MSFFKTSKKAKVQDEEIQMLKGEVNKLRRSENDFKTLRDEKEKCIDKLEQKNVQLETENKEMKEILNKQEEPYEQIYNERLELQKQDSARISKVKELESERMGLNETIKSLRYDLKSAKDELEQKKANIEATQSNCDELLKERANLESSLDELQKEKAELEDELVKLKEDMQQREVADEENSKLVAQKEKDEKFAKAYLEDVRKEMGEYKSKVEVLQLESEALKSENEALFRANEAKKKDMDETIGDLNSIRKELKIEQQRFLKLKQEWDNEKKKTEFVIVSKSADKTRKKRSPRLENDDSEDEHLVSVTEAARAEAEALREKERGLRKRINQLQIDKEELFRSGTNLFSENKTLKAKYDDVCVERSRLLQSESTLQHKLREKDKEIKDLKKNVDDLYYQNLAIKSNEENDSKKNAYVVLMGNETVKKLEREKSALNRRVKFLEKENHDIEQRVIDLEKQSNALIQYSKKYDIHTPFPPLQGPFDVDGVERRHTRYRPTGGERSQSYARIPSRERDQYSRDRRTSAQRQILERPWSNHRRNDDDTTPMSTYRAPTDRQMAQHDYRNDLRPPVPKTHSPDYYRDNAPSFSRQSSRQPSFAPSNQSHSSRFSLPPVHNHMDLQRPDSLTDKRTSRRSSPLN